MSPHAPCRLVPAGCQLARATVKSTVVCVPEPGSSAHASVTESAGRVPATPNRATAPLVAEATYQTSGISAESMARLFDPFFTTKTNGTGLGLSITRRIIQEHGGTITVESIPNEGATFIILLPSVGN